MFYVSVRQEAGVVEVQVRVSQEPFSATISAFAIGDVDGSDEVRVFVQPNISFHRELSATAARLMGSWFETTARVAEKLAFHIRERGDLRRPVTARATEDDVLVTVGELPGEGV